MERQRWIENTKWNGAIYGTPIRVKNEIHDTMFVLEMHNDEMSETIEYFMNAYVDYCYDNLNHIFSNSADIHVADSVLHLFENRENIEQFNKKALYIFIRERTGLETNNITRVVKVLKQISCLVSLSQKGLHN